MARSLYDVLGVPRDAAAADVKKAFRKLAREHHPDHNPDDPQAAERFKEINQANEVLSDPAKRQMYDDIGEEAVRLGSDPEKVRPSKSPDERHPAMYWK